MRAIVTVLGKDHVGIIAGICIALSNLGVNVLDINQTVMQEFLTMNMLVGRFLRICRRIRQSGNKA